MKRAFVCAVIASASACVAQVQWDGTGKFYQRIDTTGQLSFAQAQAAAASLTFNGMQGTLLMLNGADPVAEQLWVLQNVIRVSLPAPTAQSIYWFGASRPNTDGDRLQNWTWIDGSAIPTTLTNTWNIDYFEGSGEYAAGYHNNYGFDVGDYRQDDPAFRMGGYVVQFVPAPAAATLVGLSGLLLARRRR